MDRKNLLDLPEIRLVVLRSLSRHDAVQCMRISKAWYNSCLPFVWRNVFIEYDPNTNTITNGPSITCLERYGHFIHILHAKNIDLELPVFLNHRNLQKLKFQWTLNVSDLALACKSDPTPLIRSNPALVELGLRDLCRDISAIWKCWKPLSELRHLKILRLCAVTIRDEEAQDDFWRVCEKLETLSMIHSELPKSTPFFASATFPRMRNLIILTNRELDETLVIQLIKKCPALETLHCVPKPEGLSLVEGCQANFHLVGSVSANKTITTTT